MSYNSRVRGQSFKSRSSAGSRGQGRAQKSGRGQFIDPTLFVRPASAQELPKYEPQFAFADFEVEPLIKQNLEAKGYQTPSPIQDQAIPPALNNQDIIGIANTGTGKTAAFAVPIINKLATQRDAKVLIVAPTRELAQQIEAECRSIAKGIKLFGALLIGGSAMGPQLRDLRPRPSIVIGTPGRIKDHMERGTLVLSDFNTVVLDEVDRMLDMGFITDMRVILSNLHPVRQSMFFSATLDARVQALIETFANNPVTISVKTGDTSANVHQDVVPYSSKEDKIDQLHNLLISGDVTKSIIFEETQRSAERLSRELSERGFSADAIHGGKSQGQRQRALASFKQGDIKVLVATDVAARGIDVVDITHVINYAIPQTYSDYTHRIGRAGRAGRPGKALTFIAAR